MNAPRTSNYLQNLADLTGEINDATGTAAGPHLFERLGTRLAELLRGNSTEPVELVVVWDATDTAVLGHIVARELNAGVVHAGADLGRLELDGPIPDGVVAALVSIDWSESLDPQVLVTMLEGRGAHISIIASALPPAREVGATAAISVRHLQPDTATDQP